MKSCPKCGNQLQDNENFCPRCGNLLQTQIPQSKPGNNYKICPSCGNKVPVNAPTCYVCGADLSPAPQSAPRPQSAQPEPNVTPQYNPSYQQRPVPKTMNGRLTASLVISILGLVFSSIGYGIMGIVFGPIGIILGIVGLILANSKNNEKGGKRTAAFVCSFLAIVFGVFATAFVIIYAIEFGKY